MRLAPLVALVALAACGSEKTDHAPSVAKTVESPEPPVDSEPPLVREPPTGDEAIEFLEAWFAQIDEQHGAERLAPHAVIDIAGCTDGQRCLPRLKGLGGGDLETAFSMLKMQPFSGRLSMTLAPANMPRATLEIDLVRFGDQIMVRGIRATWKESPIPDDDAATRFVEEWLRSMEQKAPAADAGIDPANVHTEPGCNGRPACVGDYLREIMSARPILTTRVLSRGELDASIDTSGVVAARPNATFVFVEVGAIPAAKIARAELTAAVAKTADGALHVDGLDVDVSYMPASKD
jgi:hypothetical protein